MTTEGVQSVDGEFFGLILEGLSVYQVGRERFSHFCWMEEELPLAATGLVIEESLVSPL